MRWNIRLERRALKVRPWQLLLLGLLVAALALTVILGAERVVPYHAFDDYKAPGIAIGVGSESDFSSLRLALVHLRFFPTERVPWYRIRSFHDEWRAVLLIGVQVTGASPSGTLVLLLPPGSRIDGRPDWGGNGALRHQAW